MRTRLRRLSLLVACGLLAAAPALHAAHKPSKASSKTASKPVEKVDATPEALLNDMRDGTEQAPGQRVIHARGLILTGTFEPTIQAALLSRSKHFHFPSQVIARFSDATGLPNVAENSEQASPHGLSLRFTMDDGRFTDIVAHSYNGFPARTPDEFAAFLKAAASTTDLAAKNTPLARFVATHPAAKRFVTAPKVIPESYASETFYGVHTFILRNDKDKTSAGRYILLPNVKGHDLSPSEAATKSPGFLQDELRERVKHEAIMFDLAWQMPEKGDKLDDASTAWPDTRHQVILGTIYLTLALPDSEAAEKQLALNPLNLTDGVDMTDDPLLRARGATYALGASQRGVVAAPAK
jgi:catalase